MRTTNLHILIILLALLATGCRDRHAADLLLRADAVMESAPDSARALLDSVEPSRLGAADLALYAVLDAQSRHKLELPAPSDSLLTIAVDRCIAHGPDSLLMKALFYRAVGYQQIGDESNLVKDVSLAWELGNKTRQPYWTAKTAELIADINRANCNRQEEIHWRRMAAEQYELAGRMDNHLFSLCDAVIPMSNGNESAAALTLIDSLYPLTHHSEIPWLEDYYYEVSIPVMAYHGNPDRGLAYIATLDSLRNGDIPVDYELFRSHLYMRQGRNDSARLALERARHGLGSLGDTLRFWSEGMNLMASFGRYQEAYVYADSLTGGQYRWFQTIMARPNLAVQRDFYQSQYQKMSDRATSQVGWLKLAGLITLLSVLGGTAYYFWNRRRVKRQLQTIKTEVFSLREQMIMQEKLREMLEQSIETDRESHRRDLSRLSDALTENDRLKDNIMLRIDSQRMLYREKWQTLNMLCKELFEDGEMDEKLRKQRLASVRKQLVALRDRKHKKELEEAVNLYMDNIISRLREQWKKGTEKDIELAVMILAGFSANTVAFFTGIRTKYFYNLKERLVEKLEKSDAPDREEFVARLKES